MKNLIYLLFVICLAACWKQEIQSDSSNLAPLEKLEVESIRQFLPLESYGSIYYNFEMGVIGFKDRQGVEYALQELKD